MPKELLIDPEVVWDEAEELAEALVEAGGDEDKVVEAMADFLDGIFPLDKLVPGVPGLLLEAHDDDFFEVVLRELKKLFHLDPAKRAERKVKRQERRAERKAKRAEKKQGREDS